MIVLKNARKFAFVSSVANIFMYLAKMAISLATVMTCWAIVSASSGNIVTLDDIFGPLLMIFLSSYLVCAIFMSIFHTSAITILQCFLVDREIAI
mmetsp:Transcript_34076/g.24582  ORF Transcript_34076/g.24582 Transcript_34076/m.24582 type:complete len:95 (+) Transcript_34076:1646-1930(+)